MSGDVRAMKISKIETRIECFHLIFFLYKIRFPIHFFFVALHGDGELILFLQR